MNSDELLATIRARLKAAVDPVYLEGVLNYFKEPIDPYGVRTPAVKKIAAEVYRTWKKWPRPEQIRFSEMLWESGKMEEGSIAIGLNRRVSKHFTAADFKVLEKWINRWVRNWAHTDGVSSWLVAACLENDPSLMDRVPAWTRSRNRWKRRAAAVSFLQEAGAGRNTDRILAIADLMLDDADDMVQKGVGWLLKETYPKKPREVVKYLKSNKSRPTRLLLRYAAEKMTAEDRERVLG